MTKLWQKFSGLLFAGPLCRLQLMFCKLFLMFITSIRLSINAIGYCTSIHSIHFECSSNYSSDMLSVIVYLLVRSSQSFRHA